MTVNTSFMTSREGALKQKQGGGGVVEKWGNHLLQVFCSCDRNSRNCGGHSSESVFFFVFFNDILERCLRLTSSSSPSRSLVEKRLYQEKKCKEQANSSD